MNWKPIHYHAFTSLLGLATLLFACKKENFGKPMSNSSNISTVNSEKIPVERELIPRVEYPGDPADSPAFEVGEEASIATDITGAYLTIPKGIKEAGKAAAIRSEANVSDAEVQTVRFVIPRNAIAADENMVVLYRIVSDNGEGFYGLIPKKDLEVRGTSLAFVPKGLGVYQAAITPIFIGEARQVPILGANVPRLKLHSTYDTPGIARDILLQDSRAYVADGTGVEVLNWSITGGLTPSSRIPATGNINSIVSTGPRIYVAAGTAGLGVIDLARGLTLQMVDARGITNGIALAQNFNNIYLTQESTGGDGSRAGLSRFDIQQANPRYEVTGEVVGSTNSPENPYAVQIQGTFAYSLTRNALYSFDITQNDRINQRSVLPLNGSAEKLVLHVGRIYVAEKTTGVVAVDASNPSALRLLSRMALPQIVDVAAKDKYLLAIDTNRKLTLIDVSDPSNLLVLSELTLSGTPTRIRVFGDYIYVMLGDLGIAVLSIEMPAAP